MSEEISFKSKIQNLLGVTVEITLNNNTKVKGNIYTINPQSKILVIINKQNEEDNFTVDYINILEIKKLSLCEKQIDININDLLQCDVEYINKKEATNLEQDILLKKAETEPNFKRGLDIYKYLSKFYRCKYDGKKIFVDEIGCYIEEPFRLKNICGRDENNKEKLHKLVSTVTKNKK